MSEKQFEETGDMCIYHNGRWEFDDEKRIVDTITDLDKRLAPIVVEMPYSDDGSEVYQMDRTSVLHLLNKLWEENEQLKNKLNKGL